MRRSFLLLQATTGAFAGLVVLIVLLTVLPAAALSSGVDELDRETAVSHQTILSTKPSSQNIGPLAINAVPEMRIWKWNAGGYARPGGVYVYGIFYENGGDETAENVVITDTLPLSVTYAGDTSGLVPTIGADNVITWELGTVVSGTENVFMVTIDVPSDMPVGEGSIGQNCAFISTSTPGDSDLDNNQQCADTVDVWIDDVELGIDKWVNPVDPTPGEQFFYTLQWCNHRGAAAGPVWLTDTLPVSTTLLFAEPSPSWATFFTETTRTETLLGLYAPGLPGDQCGEFHLTLQLDVDAPLGTELTTYTVLETADDVDFENNEILLQEAVVSEPRYDGYLEKRTHQYVLVPDGWVNYFFYYENKGNVPISVRFTETIPAGLSYDFAHWGGNQPQQDDPFPDPVITGAEYVWELGMLGVGDSAWFHIQMNISNTLSAGDMVTNCATVSVDGEEDTPEDNISCYDIILNESGPNLRVTKSHEWENNNRLRYQVYFENIGDQAIAGVYLTDTLPLDTTYNGEWNYEFNDRLITDTNNGTQLFWELGQLNPGEYGNIFFVVDLDDPGMPLRWFTNTVEITTLPDDIAPDDNAYEDVAFSGGEVWWLSVDVNRNYIGGGTAVGPITVTTQYTTSYYDCCEFGWEAPHDFLPGGVFTVTAGEGMQPVVVHIPDPFTVEADSNTNMVWGQIDHLDHEWVTVDQYGGPHQEVQTDGNGNFTAMFADVARGGEGEVRYNTMIDYADVYFQRQYKTPDLIMTVNYGHDWVEGNYETGHTVWITATESDGITIKATAVLTTGEVPWWGGNTGFSTNWQGWMPDQPDLLPGDWIFGRVDNGEVGTVRIGTIDGVLDTNADTVAGTIDANWFSDLLYGNCSIWEENGPDSEEFLVDPNGGAYDCDFSAEWDIQPGHSVAVQYQEPDNDWVINMFEDPTPALEIHKRANGDAAEGGNIVFTIDYNNHGDVAAENTFITDTMEGMAYLTDSSSFAVVTGTLPGGDEYVMFDLGELVAGAQGSFDVFAEITAVANDTITNTAEITASNLYNRDNPENQISQWVGEVFENQTDLNIGKYAWTGDPAPDTDFVWAMNICNNGSTASTEVTLTDTLPLSTTLVSWWGQDPGWTEVVSSSHQLVVSRPSVSGWWCGEVYARVHLDAEAWPGMLLENMAVITASNDLTPDNNQAFWEGEVNEPHTNLQIEKWWNWGQLVPGGEIRYQIDYNNNGNVPVTERIRITDTLPVSTSFIGAWHYDNQGAHPVIPIITETSYVVWEIDSLDNGYSNYFEVALRVADDAVPNTVLTNTVEISPQPNEDNDDDNMAMWVEILNEFGPNLRVTKWGSWDNWDENTRRVSYHVRVENIGNVRMQHVMITDTYSLLMDLDGGIDTEWWRVEDWNHDAANHMITITFDSLEPGEISWLNFGTIVPGNEPLDFGLAYTNTVEVMVDPAEVNPNDNSANAVVSTGPDLYVEKELVGGELLPGELVTFSLRFGNNRQGHEWWWNMQGDAWLTDTLPIGFEYITSTQRWCEFEDWCALTPTNNDGTNVGWQLWPLAAGEWNEIYVTVRIPDLATGEDTYINWAEITSAEPLSDTEAFYDNNIDSIGLVIALPHFAVSKEYESSEIAGRLVTYTLTIVNTGNEAGHNVVLSDTLPSNLVYETGDGNWDGTAVTWTFSEILPGETVTGWFSAILPCSGNVTNDTYLVISSDEGISSEAGSPVSFAVLAPTIEAAMVYAPLSPVIEEMVYFTSTVSTNGTALAATWAFGDGITATGYTVSHAYAEANDFSVVLTAMDICGYQDQAAVTVTVTTEQYMVFLPIIVKP